MKTWVRLYEEPPGRLLRKIASYKHYIYYRIYKSYTLRCLQQLRCRQADEQSECRQIYCLKQYA